MARSARMWARSAGVESIFEICGRASVGERDRVGPLGAVLAPGVPVVLDLATDRRRGTAQVGRDRPHRPFLLQRDLDMDPVLDTTIVPDSAAASAGSHQPPRSGDRPSYGRSRRCQPPQTSPGPTTTPPTSSAGDRAAYAARTVDDPSSSTPSIIRCCIDAAHPPGKPAPRLKGGASTTTSVDLSHRNDGCASIASRA